MKWRCGWIVFPLVFGACSESTVQSVVLEEYSCQVESSSSELSLSSSAILLSSSAVSDLVMVRSSTSAAASSSSLQESSSSVAPYSSSQSTSSSSWQVFRITGCQCVAEASEVDYLQESGSWSVSGCDVNIEHYEWGDVSSKGPLAVYHFTYAGETFAPRVVVYDSEKNYAIVSCPEVRAVESVNTGGNPEDS